MCLIAPSCSAAARPGKWRSMCPRTRIGPSRGRRRCPGRCRRAPRVPRRRPRAAAWSRSTRRPPRAAATRRSPARRGRLRAARPGCGRTRPSRAAAGRRVAMGGCSCRLPLSLNDGLRVGRLGPDRQPRCTLGLMRWANYDSRVCSIARTVEVLGDRWTLLVLRDIFNGIRRFADLGEHLGMARDVLAKRLALLVEEGLVHRVPYREPGARTRYEYRLTDAGRDLRPVLLALLEWGDKYRADPGGPPAWLFHAECGAPVRVDVRCAEGRSEEHTSELQSRPHLVCRLLLEKKKKQKKIKLFYKKKKKIKKKRKIE